MVGQLMTGLNVASYRSDPADGAHVAVQSGIGCVFVSVSNGVSRMEQMLSLDEAAAMAHAMKIAVLKATHSVVAVKEAPNVHTHGAEDGPGLSCPERLVNGMLLGECTLDAEASA